MLGSERVGLASGAFRARFWVFVVGDAAGARSPELSIAPDACSERIELGADDPMVSPVAPVLVLSHEIVPSETGSPRLLEAGDQRATSIARQFDAAGLWSLGS